jgi:hypothetical protein
VLGAIWLAGAAARDATLKPGEVPARREQSRGRAVALGTALILAGGIYAGTVRWQNMDREYRNNALYRPLPVVATVRTNGSLRLLHLTPPPDNPGTPAWDALVADHGKLMHLFLLRAPDCNAFAHLHPVRRDGLTFENVLPPLPAGAYWLYAEITHENGMNQTLTAKLSVLDSRASAPQFLSGSNMFNDVFCQSVVAPVGNASQPFALDADDSWHTSFVGPVVGQAVSPLMGGSRMVFKHDGDLIENREAPLRFAVFAADGQPAVLQPYMGMGGHAVVRRSDGEVFTHLHPVGTISMAAQELFARREDTSGRIARELSASNAPAATMLRPSGTAGVDGGNEVSFPFAFPRPGDYRLWVQVRTSGRVLTGVFDVRVKAAR